MFSTKSLSKKLDSANFMEYFPEDLPGFPLTEIIAKNISMTNKITLDYYKAREYEQEVTSLLKL